MLYTAATTAGAWKLGSPFGGQDEDVSLVFVPIFWIGGEDLALLVPVVSGTACVLMARWDPLAVLTAVERFRVTHLVAAVDSYVEIMELPTPRRFDLSSLRLTLAASLIRKLDVGVRRAWREYAGTNSVLREGAFGMTETHSMDTSTAGLEGADADLNTRPVFCGLPVPGTEIKVVEFGSGKVIPLGEEGEIAVRSPSVFTGYWRAPEATATALRDGWLHTGDVGIIDESGCLHFLGRKKEMIKVKGMSVFPTEIESLMRMHPAVTAVAVVPKDDEIRGQVPVAFIELAPNTNCTAEELSAWAQENMARYKVPQIRLIEAIPRTATGKMKKGELLDRV
jgi:acyl-CoA synthetase (AMP-forming)/AMP-acid ligase II